MNDFIKYLLNLSDKEIILKYWWAIGIVLIIFFIVLTYMTKE
jgi:uncharacterized membrane protein